MKRFKDKVRGLTSRKRGKSLGQVIPGIEPIFPRMVELFPAYIDQVLPQRAQNLDNAAAAKSFLETMEKSQNQGSES